VTMSARKKFSFYFSFFEEILPNFADMYVVFAIFQSIRCFSLTYARIFGKR
jgi:hypothetical protein